MSWKKDHKNFEDFHIKAKLLQEGKFFLVH